MQIRDEPLPTAEADDVPIPNPSARIGDDRSKPHSTLKTQPIFDTERLQCAIPAVALEVRRTGTHLQKLQDQNLRDPRAKNPYKRQRRH